MLQQHVGHVAGQGKQLLLVDACMRNVADQADRVQANEVSIMQTKDKLFANLQVQMYGLL